METMEQGARVLRIPYGTRDFLPHEAAGKRAVDTALARLFAQWGYDEVVTPMLEDVETLASGGTDEAQLFKFFDANNRTIALRHEMTTPIARLASARMREAARPLRLSYSANVYRHEQAQTGRQCEFYQAGVELMGEAAATADAEVLALAILALREAGLTAFQINLGQVEFVHGLMQQMQLDEAARSAVKEALVARDLVGLEARLEGTQLRRDERAALLRIPMLYGKEEALAEAYALAGSAQSRSALDNLMQIYRLLEAYGVQDAVRFDFGVVRDFEYYTGMVFEAYAPGLGFPLCGGGRYDQLLAAFGAACPATGFALGIERLLLALQRQGCAAAAPLARVYVGWCVGRSDAAIAAARRLRGQGRAAEVALRAEPREAAQASCVARGCAELLYVE